MIESNHYIESVWNTGGVWKPEVDCIAVFQKRWDIETEIILSFSFKPLSCSPGSKERPKFKKALFLNLLKDSRILLEITKLPRLASFNDTWQSAFSASSFTFAIWESIHFPASTLSLINFPALSASLALMVGQWVSPRVWLLPRK